MKNKELYNECHEDMKTKFYIKKKEIMDAFMEQFKSTKELYKRIDSVIYYYATVENGKSVVHPITYPGIEELAKTHEYVSMLNKTPIPILRRM